MSRLYPFVWQLLHSATAPTIFSQLQDICTNCEEIPHNCQYIFYAAAAAQETYCCRALIK